MRIPTEKRFVLTACIPGLLLLLTGCASPYVAPDAGEPTALISFEVNGDPIFGYVASFSFFEEGEDRSCGSQLQRMASINKGNPLAGKTTNTTDIPIPTGRPIIIRSRIMPAAAFSQQSCGSDNVLVADADKTYLLTIEWLANQCDVELFDTTTGEPVPVRFRKEVLGCR